MVACLVVHLASEQMLRSLDSDMSIGLVDLDAVLESLGDLLGQSDLLLWYKLVGQSLRL